MSVKLGRYIFRRIGGRIVPIRSNLMEKLLDQLSDKKLTSAFHKTKMPAIFGKLKKKEKIGSGVTFNVIGPFSSPRESMFVLKIPKESKSQWNVAKAIKKDFPGIENPSIRHVVLGENLPNFGVPTVPSKLVRMKRKNFAVLQEYSGRSLYDDFARVPADARRERLIMEKNIKYASEAGLKLDTHYQNLTSGGYLRDTALAKPPNLKNMRSPVARELFEGIERISKRPDYISRNALEESPKAVRKINALLKKGFRFKKTKEAAYWEVIGDEYKLLSPQERVAEAKYKGIRFVKKNGKIVPMRPKK